MLAIKILVGCCLLLVAAYVKHYFKRRQYPPGPLGVPFVGDKPIRILKFFFPKIFYTKSEKEIFSDMKNIYGDMWSIDVGDKTIVVFASFEKIQEAFVENGKQFLGRPSNGSFYIFGKNRGMLFNDGEIWNDNRQLTIKALRELGMGKKIMETHILEDAEEMVEEIEKHCSKPVINPEIFDKPSMNTIIKTVFGERYKYDDPDFEWFLKNVKSICHSNDAHFVMETFWSVLSLKWIKRLFPVVNVFQVEMDECMKFIINKCKERIKVEGEFSKPSCIFDFFWRYRYQDQPKVSYEERLLNIGHSIFDILIGAGDTVNNILGFSCLMLGKDRELQNDLRQEIQNFACNYKFISMDMRKNCVKVLSFMDEINRFFPLDTYLHHRAVTDCVYKGYKIRSHDTVYGDLNTVLRDPTQFENPDTFNAYRFLDKTRTKHMPNRSVIPFGVGKRSCPGQSIADMDQFIFLTTVISRFDISLTEETKKDFDKILEGTVGLIYAPLDHTIIFNIIESK